MEIIKKIKDSKFFKLISNIYILTSLIFFIWIFFIDSNLLFSTNTFFKPSAFFTCNKKDVFLMFESTRVMSFSGLMIARHIPGNPAPLPTSKIDPFFVCWLSRAQSMKCSARSFLVSFLDIKFLVLFHLKT